MKTKAEVRAFLDSQVGKRVNPKAGVLNGQCVTLVKALMEELGVPNPYAARGHAKDVGNRYVADGIAENGKGWLTVCINPKMAAPYGHVWIDLAGEANYEQNGAVALTTTKNTRPISHARQFVNFDKWIKEPPKEVKEVVTFRELEVLYRLYFGIPVSEHGKKYYLGKKTFEEVQDIMVNSKEYKALVEKRGQSQIGFSEHLPTALRKVIKLREQE